MPNIKGFRPLANQEWISVDFDDGSSLAVNDPTGEYRAQVSEIAQKIKGIPPNPMQGALASVGGEITSGAGSALARADTPASLSPSPRPGSLGVTAVGAPQTAAGAVDAPGSDAVRQGLKYAMKPPPDPSMPGGENAAVAAPVGQKPAEKPPVGAGGARAPGLVVTDATSSWQKTEQRGRQTSGMAPEDKAKVDAANEATVGALDEANVADYASKVNQFWNEWTRLSEQGKRQVAERAALQEQERRFDESLNAAYKNLDDTAARPIDPSQAFAGEKYWYAFMAGFGEVLRDVGAALAGEEPVADPGAMLAALVERSVNLQMAQKKADYEAGRISVDRLTADRETTRHRLGLVLSQLADTEMKKAQTQADYAALGAIKAKGDAIVADARAKAATATARQETISDTTNRVSGGTVQRGLPRPAGGSLDDVSKLLDIEKKRLELSNAELDRQDAAGISATIGKQVSPARAKELRDAVKQIDPQMAKLDSTLQALQAQLGINGATFDRNTGKVIWPTDVSGVSAIRWTDIPVPGGDMITTDASRLDAQQAFLKELVTTDTTGAVASAQQMPAFQQVVGGSKHNEEQYKESVENFAKYLVERRNGYLAPLGEDGVKLYRDVESKVRRGLAPSATPIGTLPQELR